MDKKLYLISNMGCDDTAWGLAWFSEEELSAFIHVIEDLNKNSTYSCQPTISIYNIGESDVRPVTPQDNIDDEWGDHYIEEYKILYLDGVPYTYADEWISPYSSFEQVFPYKF